MIVVVVIYGGGGCDVQLIGWQDATLVCRERQAFRL